MRDFIFNYTSSQLVDLTDTLNDIGSAVETVTLNTTDFIYIGSQLPITSKHCTITTSNPTAANLAIEYWDGSEWRAASYKRDATAVSGTPFAQSGYINFYTDKRYSWTPADTTQDGVENITGLGDVTLYDLYWCRLSVDANCSFQAAAINDIFCQDANLKAISPSVLEAQFMDDWEAGKTSWRDQCCEASDLVKMDLMSRFGKDSSLLLDKTELEATTAYRTLAIIFQEMGDLDRSQMYMSEYDKMLKTPVSLDKNQNGKPNSDERRQQTTRMVR